MSSPRTPTDRLGRGDIEAAITAHNSARGHTVLLPPDAVRLLTAMFSEDDVCRRSVRSLAAEGFDARTIRHLLRALLDAGFLSKVSARRGVLTSYRLHLPPWRQP
jgi:hypothetical protein